MSEQKVAQAKTITGVVISDKMEKTVNVKVTTFKTHRLYHKRYRWTKNYLSDIGEHQPKVGDTVKIVAGKPMSKHKRFTVVEVITAGEQEKKAVQKQASKAQPKAAAKKKAK